MFLGIDKEMSSHSFVLKKTARVATASHLPAVTNLSEGKLSFYYCYKKIMILSLMRK